MAVHITNLFGMAPFSTAQIAQNMVADFAEKDLGFKEIGIFFYDNSGESQTEAWARYDGILASLATDDAIVLQTPTWNSVDWEAALVNRLNLYPELKKIMFIHDFPPLMFKNNAALVDKYIAIYNQADVIIAPTVGMVTALRARGMKVKKVVIQGMWDHAANFGSRNLPPFKKLINFAGNPSKFNFLDDLDTSSIKLRLFSNDEVDKPNTEVTGWMDDAHLLMKLHDGGGFGLVWGNGEYLRDYMKIDCSYKESTYLAAGLPVIVRDENPSAQLISQNGLGIVVNTLDEAVSQINSMDEDTYDKMIAKVNQFGHLIRNGYFTKRALVEAVFQAYLN